MFARTKYWKNMYLNDTNNNTLPNLSKQTYNQNIIITDIF